MTAYQFVPEDSTLHVETRAKGMLAKLAHDLHIDAKLSSVVVEGDVKVTAELRPEDLTVRGVLKGASVDRGVLSAGDVRSIQEKIRAEVFTRPIRCTASIPANGKPDGHTQADLTFQLGARQTSTRASVTLTTDGGKTRARGRATLTLTSLGITPPKGPLNAFRVDDEVVVVFELAFRDATG
jgi:hypothetical protein